MEPVQTALIKAGESAIEISEEAARGFLSKVAGPAAEEAGLLLQDKVRLYRFGNQVKSITKAKKMMENAGLTPSEIPLRTLLPLLNGAALEDDHLLSDKWAALIANASNSQSNVIPPSFPAILSEMSPADAAILDSCTPMFDDQENRHCKMVTDEWIESMSMRQQEFDVSVDNLEQLGLVLGAGSFSDDEATGTPLPSLEIRGRVGIAFTHLGWTFMKACQPPVTTSL